MMSQLCALIFQQENHYACTLELLPFVSASAGIHAGTPNTTNPSKPLHLFLNLIFMPVTLSPRYFSVPSYQSLNLFTYSQQNTSKYYKQTRMMDATYQLTNIIK